MPGASSATRCQLSAPRLSYPVPPLTGDVSHLTYPVPAQCATPRLPGARCYRPDTRPQLAYPVPPRTGDISRLRYLVPAQLPGATPRLPGASYYITRPDTRPQLAYPVPPRTGDISYLGYPVPYSAENVLRAIWPGLPYLPGELPRVCPLLSLPALPHGTRPHNSLTLCASLPCSHLTYLVPAPGYLVDLRPTAPLGSPDPSPTILV